MRHSYDGYGLTLLAALALALGGPAAASETDWQENLGGRTRLIAAGPMADATGTTDFALQIELKKGWKTYWRNPGDSGVATEFDFTGSANLGSVEVLWPAPKSYRDDYGTSIGYKGSLVIPLRAEPARGSLPLVLDVTVRYGVCDQICVPVENAFSLVVTRATQPDPAAATLIEDALRSVPKPAVPAGGLAVTQVRRSDHTLTVVARVPAPRHEPELFVEGPRDWYFPLPQKAFETESEIGWTVPLADLPEGAHLPGETLTFTLVNGPDAREQDWRLD